MNSLEKRVEALEARNQPDPPPVTFDFEVEPAKGPIKITLPAGKFRIIEPEEPLQARAKSSSQRR